MSRLSVLVASLIVLAGCGGSVSVNEKGKVSVNHKTLSTAAVPFTFEYPLEFREATDASVKAINALAVVGPAADSYLAVRRNGTAMTVAALERQARRALGASLLAAKRETHSGLPMVAITVADEGGGDAGLRSTIYGFSLGGSSWLLECHSAAADRATIDAACAKALDTIKPKGT